MFNFSILGFAVCRKAPLPEPSNNCEPHHLNKTNNEKNLGIWNQCYQGDGTSNQAHCYQKANPKKKQDHNDNYYVQPIPYEPESEKPKLFAAIDRQDIKEVQQELINNPEDFRANIADSDYGAEDIYPAVFYAVDAAIKQDEEKRKVGYEIIKLILDAGASPNEVREHRVYSGYGSTSYHKGETPLLAAIKARDAVIVGLLLDARATVSGDIRQSPVGIAVRSGYSAVVSVMASHPNVTLQQKQLGLFISVQVSVPEFCEMFLKSIPTDQLVPGSSGYRYLEIAATFGNYQILDLLIGRGLHKTEQYPLHASIRESNQASLDYFLTAGVCNINARDSTGNTPLLEAARRKMVHAFKELIAHGCDLDVESNDGFTVLLGLVQWKDFNTLKEFLERSSKHVNTKLRNTGRSPLSTVVNFSDGFEDAKMTFELLVHHGADVNLAQPQLLCALCENVNRSLFDYVLDTYKPRVDYTDSMNPVTSLFKNKADKPERLLMLNRLFVHTGWNGEHTENILQSRIQEKYLPVLRYFQKWPVLRVLWIAFKKGNESEFRFSQLAWPLMAQLLRWVGEVNHIPKLYKD